MCPYAQLNLDSAGTLTLQQQKESKHSYVCPAQDRNVSLTVLKTDDLM